MAPGLDCSEKSLSIAAIEIPSGHADGQDMAGKYEKSHRQMK
jgi:hypothetical protein